MAANICDGKTIELVDNAHEFLLQLLNATRGRRDLKRSCVYCKPSRASPGNEIQGDVESARQNAPDARLRAQAAGHQLRDELGHLVLTRGGSVLLQHLICLSEASGVYQ